MTSTTSGPFAPSRTSIDDACESELPSARPPSGNAFCRPSTLGEVQDVNAQSAGWQVLEPRRAEPARGALSRPTHRSQRPVRPAQTGIQRCMQAVWIPACAERTVRWQPFGMHRVRRASLPVVLAALDHRLMAGKLAAWRGFPHTIARNGSWRSARRTLRGGGRRLPGRLGEDLCFPRTPTRCSHGNWLREGSWPRAGNRPAVFCRRVRREPLSLER